MSPTLWSSLEIPTALVRAGFFGFVWLDYCGSFASGAGRQRQGDILSLLRGLAFFKMRDQISKIYRHAQSTKNVHTQKVRWACVGRER